MTFGYRLFLGYCLLLALGGSLLFREFSEELRPGLRQPLEEALVDNANLLAELVTAEMTEGRIADGDFAAALSRFGERRLNAEIWSLQHRLPDLFVYVTDAQGIVLFDSRGGNIGADFSRWNDVYLTLKGEYGARSSRDDPEDPSSSVMYVAAPIRQAGQLAGVLTLAKPGRSVQPYIDQLQAKLLEKALWLVLLSLLLGGTLSFWLSRSIGRLTAYARGVKAGQRTTVPHLSEPELAQLAGAMESMREALEGKDYVEHYLHGLTHELKSPLAAIQGAGELLQESMPEADRRRFLANIRNETRRMQQLVERLLGLAALEKRQGLEQVTRFSSRELLGELSESRTPALEQRKLRLELKPGAGCNLQGERFLLLQAIGNLLDNAIEFSPSGGRIRLQEETDGEHWTLTVDDQGPGIPDYAQGRVFERFYSLPRPDGSPKSSGLGLALVREVALLHGGRIELEPGPGGGTRARFELPLHIRHT